MGNKEKGANAEGLIEYSHSNQLKVGTGVHRTRSLIDKTHNWLRGNLYFNNHNANNYIKLSVMLSKSLKLTSNSV